MIDEIPLADLSKPPFPPVIYDSCIIFEERKWLITRRYLIVNKIISLPHSCHYVQHFAPAVI